MQRYNYFPKHKAKTQKKSDQMTKIYANLTKIKEKQGKTAENLRFQGSGEVVRL